MKHFSDVPAFQAGELGAVPGIRSMGNKQRPWAKTKAESIRTMVSVATLLVSTTTLIILIVTKL